MAHYLHVTPFRTKATRPAKPDAPGREIDFDFVSETLVAPAAERADLPGGRVERVDPGSIHETMFQAILEADLVIADITIDNANVWYELGIRHALRKKGTLLMKASVSDKTPFDILGFKYFSYDVDDPSRDVDALASEIRAARASKGETDSPIFKVLPALQAADPEALLAVPREFAEEVERARALGSWGWLRLISGEVRELNLRFRRPGLRLVGNAQFDANDFDGARETFEAVRADDGDDQEANHRLATIYERLARKTSNHDRWLDLMSLSDQAISRLLDNGALSSRGRAEALSLKGRNLKSRWRDDFKALADLPQRRARAMSRFLVDCYEAYLGAFFEDLNHFYPGVTALQMNAIARDLAKDTDAWADAFDDPERERKRLEDDHDACLPVVRQSIVRAAKRFDEGRSEDPQADQWARNSAADLSFLEGDREARVVRKFAELRRLPRFYADAAIGQLTLYESLGLNADTARAAIEALRPEPTPAPEPSPPRRRHVVLVAGHQIDAHGSATPRFPPDAEARAKERLEATLRELINADEEVRVFASAASGTDLICHEVCQALGIHSIVCLPVPAEDFARNQCFDGRDHEWRNRFLRLVNHRPEAVRTLSEGAGLPTWLPEHAADPWARGNRWVFEMARLDDADERTFIALWDGNRDAADGGTAQLVRLTEGHFLFKHIPVQQLAAG